MRSYRRIPSTLAKMLFVLCVGLFAAACQDGSADHGQDDDGLSDGDGMISDDDDDDATEDGDTFDGDEETCDGCLIEGSCVPSGQEHQESACALCDPERDVNGWSPKLQGTECRGAAGVCDVAEVCDGVSNDCPVDGKATTECRAAGGVCDVTEFCDGVSNDCPADALQLIGELCNEVDQCDGAGVCVDCIDERGCNDNLNCTTDTCTTDGACTHELNPGSCLIDGICYAQNEELSTNRCRYCDVTIMTDGWIYKPINSDCDDGLYCNGTGDTCNNSGECLHPGSPCPETECEHCNENEDSCYDPVGAACGDSTDTDCDGADTCNGAGNCQSNFAADGAECDLDGIACIVDTCLGGVCIAGQRSDLYCDSDGESWTHEICDRTYDCYDSGWAKSFGLATADFMKREIVHLSDGGFAITSYFEGNIDFDPDHLGGEHTSNGGFDIFLAVFNADGSYRWSKSFGEWNQDYSRAVMQLSNGGIAIVGHFYESLDFNPGQPGGEHTSNGGWDIFLAVFNADGNYRWSKTFGGTGIDGGRTATQLSDGGMAITGYFSNTIDFDPDYPGGEHTSSDGDQIFLAAFNEDGSYRWSLITGSVSDYGITQLSDGGLAITGFLSDTIDFDPENEGGEHTSNGGWDIFLAVFNADGSYRWSKSFGGTNNDVGYAITKLSDGGMAITGYFRNTIDFDPETEGGEHTSNGSEDIFLAVFEADGSYRWSETFGGTAWDDAFAITQLSDGGLAITGQFWATIDFDPENEGGEYTTKGYYDILLAVFDVDGGYRWSEAFGGTSGEYGRGITQLSDGGLVLTGLFTSSSIDFDPGDGTNVLSYNGEGNFFLLRVNPPPVCHDAATTDCSDNGTCTWASGTGICSCQEGLTGEFCEIEE